MSNRHGSDHMANERTFLAWIRTSIGIMAFGFVLQKFSLFVEQMALFTGKLPQAGAADMPELSAVNGFILIVLGAVTTVMAYVKFRLTSRQIENDNYKPLYLFDLAITLAVLAVAVILAVYLKPDST